MDLRLIPRLKDNPEPLDDEVYRLTLDGYTLRDILSGSQWHSPAIIRAAVAIEALPQRTDKGKFEFMAEHPEQLPPGVKLIE